MWYGVSVLIRGSCDTKSNDELTWCNSVFLIDAGSEDEAKSLGVLAGQAEECTYLTSSGETLSWEFVAVEKVFEIQDELKSGAEIFHRFLTNSEAISLQTPFPY
jgi:hypothetical protein